MAKGYPEGFEPIVDAPVYPVGFEPIVIAQPAISTKVAGQPSIETAQTGVFPKSNLNQILARTAKEVLPYAGLAAGGAIASPADILAGPAPTIAGAGLGYSIGNSLADVISNALGIPTGVQPSGSIPLDLASEAVNVAQNFNEGVGAELGGRAVGAVAAPVLGQLGRLSDVIKESANKKVAEGLLRGGGNAQQKAIVERITPEILDRPFLETAAVTGKGLENKAAIAKEAAGEAIEAFGALQGNANPQQIVTALEKLKQPHIVAGKSINDEAIIRIQKVQDILNQYRNSLSLEELRAIRRAFDSEVAKSKGFFKTLDEGSLLDIKKTASNEIRGILAQSEPDLALLNKEYNFWSNFDEVVSATNLRKKGQTGIGPIITTAGAVMTGRGPVDMAARGAAVSAINSALQSPGWKLASARVRSNLADAIASGNSDAVLKSAESITKLGISDSNSKEDLNTIIRNNKQ